MAKKAVLISNATIYTERASNKFESADKNKLALVQNVFLFFFLFLFAIYFISYDNLCRRMKLFSFLFKKLSKFVNAKKYLL